MAWPVFSLLPTPNWHQPSGFGPRDTPLIRPFQSSAWLHEAVAALAAAVAALFVCVTVRTSTVTLLVRHASSSRNQATTKQFWAASPSAVAWLHWRDLPKRADEWELDNNNKRAKVALRRPGMSPSTGRIIRSVSRYTKQQQIS